MPFFYWILLTYQIWNANGQLLGYESTLALSETDITLSGLRSKNHPTDIDVTKFTGFTHCGRMSFQRWNLENARYIHVEGLEPQKWYFLRAFFGYQRSFISIGNMDATGRSACK